MNAFARSARSPIGGMEGRVEKDCPSNPLPLSLPLCLFARLQVGPIEKALSRAHRMPPFDLNSHFGEEGAARALKLSLQVADIARRMQLKLSDFLRMKHPENLNCLTNLSPELGSIQLGRSTNGNRIVGRRKRKKRDARGRAQRCRRAPLCFLELSCTTIGYL